MKKGKLKKVLSSLLVTAVAFSAFTSPVSAKTFTKDEKKVEVSKEKQLERKVVGYFPEWAYKSEAQRIFRCRWPSMGLSNSYSIFICNGWPSYK